MSVSSARLRFLGAGGAFSRRYGTTCSVLTVGEEAWLIDCGRQAPDQMHDAGIAWHDIHGQLITHVHGDHVYGLEDFAFMRYFTEHGGVAPVYAGGPRPKLVAHAAVLEEVWEFLGPSLRWVRGPDGDLRSGRLEHYFDVLSADSSEPPRDDAWNHAERFELGDLSVTARETGHVPGKPACALEFRVGDSMAYWSGDSTVDVDRLTAVAQEATVIFHDCTFFEYPEQVHGAFSLLRTLPTEARARTVLMHHEDDFEQHRAEVEALGFRVAMPGAVFDLHRGQQVDGD
jgi:ribonuclease BN (tRNA processing enzyme)